MYYFPNVLFFTEDLNEIAGVCTFSAGSSNDFLQGSCYLDTINIIDANNTLINNPEQEFCLVNNNDREIKFLLNKENKPDIKPDKYKPVEIRGDYFQALKEYGIQVSFNEITSRKNLIKMDLTNS